MAFEKRPNGRLFEAEILTDSQVREPSRTALAGSLIDPASVDFEELRHVVDREEFIEV